jgi:hypothetical protein
MRRRIMLGSAAILASAMTALTMGAGSASARANVTGSGTYNCSKVSGTITFKPPLKFTAQTVTTTVKTLSSGCVGGKPAVTSEMSNSVTTKPNQSCAGLVGSTPFTIKSTYTNGAIPSTLSGTAKPVISGTTVTFTITGKTSGSYPSLSTVAKAVIKQTTTQLNTACGSTGVATINIVSGTITKE